MTQSKEDKEEQEETPPRITPVDKCGIWGCENPAIAYDCCLQIYICRDCGWDKEIDAADPSAVDHPSHYTTRKIETIDVIIDWNLNYCEGNIIKYLSRYKHKGEPLQDLKKAQWYLKRLVQENEN